MSSIAVEDLTKSVILQNPHVGVSQNLSKEKPRILLILGCDEEGGIGKNNGIPWKCPDDMTFFKRMTMGGTVIMGRLTYESMGKRHLPGRYTYVIGTGYYSSLEEVLQQPLRPPVCIIGGAVFAGYALDHNYIDEIYLSFIDGKYQCDVFLPKQLDSIVRQIRHLYYNQEAKEILPPDNHPFNVRLFMAGKNVNVYQCQRGNPEELQLHTLVRKICSEGVSRGDRTGVGTTSIFGHQMKFSLRNGVFPIQTTRKTSLKMIFEELMWFLRGQTDSNILVQKGVHIWKGNSSRKALDMTGLSHLREGDCGPIYGFQWRHWGAKYISCDHDYSGQGHDQLQDVVTKIKADPLSRRIILSGWNVNDLDEMSLPPCHTMYQFFVARGELSCHMYQRSSDVMLACHWNITSAALLTILLAKFCHLKPGELTVSYGDSHVYNNHAMAATEYLQRIPFQYPTLEVLTTPTDMTKFQFEDLKLTGYVSHPAIRMEMNV